jgi:hypothetical protein
MITPLQLEELYNNLIGEINSDENLKIRINYQEPGEEAFDNVTEESTITESQWQLLVEVCHMIVANTNKFRMDSFHGIGHNCGTTHCIAGWAVAVAAGDNDCNYFRYFRESYNNFMDSLPSAIRVTFATSDYAAYLISEYTKPFFYITNNYGYSDDSVTAEDLVMKHFVLPILNIAEEESFQLSDEANRMIAQIKNNNNARQDCLV